MRKLILIIAGLVIGLAAAAQWNRAAGIPDRFVTSVRSIGNYVFATTDGGVYRSSNGIAWQLKVNGMDGTNLFTYRICKAGDYLYAASFKGVYRSSDYGDTWMATNYPAGYPAISLYAVNNIVLASTTGGGLFRSPDCGNTWQPISGDHFYQYAMACGTLFASTYQDVSVSADTGLTWQSAGLFNWAQDLLNIRDTILATTFSDNLASSPCAPVCWSYLSDLRIDSAVAFASKTDTVYLCTRDSIFYFADRNVPARRLSLEGLDIFPGREITTVEVFDGFLLAGTADTSGTTGKGVWYYSLTSSGIPYPDDENSVKVYPNPADALIFFTAPMACSRITVCNSLGQQVYAADEPCSPVCINTEPWPAGSYFIRIFSVSGHPIRTQKLIKL